jgi:hypothetical protein
VKSGQEPLLPVLIAFNPKDKDYRWNALQPDWRRIESSPEDIESHDWVKKVKGPWGALKCNGVNGFQSLLALLKWWIILDQEAVVESEKKKMELDPSKSADLWNKMLANPLLKRLKITKSHQLRR